MTGPEHGEVTHSFCESNRHLPDAVLMFAQRRRRWTNFKTASGIQLTGDSMTVSPKLKQSITVYAVP